MAGWEAVCATLRSLPETALDSGIDHPAWRVNGKVLARRNPRMRTPEEDRIRSERGELISIWTGHEDREALVRQSPDTFFFTPHWASSQSVLVWLERIDEQLLEELLVDAWRSRAPKRLVREWEDRAGRPGPGPGPRPKPQAS